jgi:hypothetical protein
MIIDLSARFSEPVTVYNDDPAIFSHSEGQTAQTAMMGDIVHCPNGEMDLSVNLETTSPIERVDIFNGLDLVETVRPFSERELGKRIRVVWEGAEYRGRFREVIWDGTAVVDGNEILAVDPINFFNPDKRLECDGNTVNWEALTTGNCGGIDIRLADENSGEFRLNCPLVDEKLKISDIGLEDTVFDVSGELPRSVRIFRLPDENAACNLAFRRKIKLKPTGDNPIFVRLTQEDGTRAWTSPIYVFGHDTAATRG